MIQHKLPLSLDHLMAAVLSATHARSAFDTGHAVLGGDRKSALGGSVSYTPGEEMAQATILPPMASDDDVGALAAEISGLAKEWPTKASRWDTWLRDLIGTEKMTQANIDGTRTRVAADLKNVLDRKAEAAQLAAVGAPVVAPAEPAPAKASVLGPDIRDLPARPPNAAMDEAVDEAAHGEQTEKYLVANLISDALADLRAVDVGMAKQLTERWIELDTAGMSAEELNSVLSKVSETTARIRQKQHRDADAARLAGEVAAAA